MGNADYITISVTTLSPGIAVGVDLYCHDAATDEVRLYKQADYPLGEGDLRRLRARGIRRLLINRGGHDQYQHYLRSLLAEEGRTAQPITARIGAMNEIVRDVLRECFTSGDLQQTVTSANRIGHLAAELVCDERFVTGDLLRILHHDYSTFTHSANVAYYAVILAKALGFPRDDLPEVAAGALLHDLGKLEVSEAILSKPGRLDEFEFRQIKRHPRDGFRKLCRREDFSEAQLLMVYQHHERLDGGGYPVGCRGEEIHPWGKLCAIVDVFEALTSARPYRQAMSRARAMELMDRDQGRAFDPEMYACWKEMITNASTS